MGLMIFPTLRAAIQQGFEPYERTADGFMVRTHTSRGWALALALTA